MTYEQLAEAIYRYFEGYLTDATALKKSMIEDLMEILRKGEQP